MKKQKIVAGKEAILGRRYERLPENDTPFDNAIKNQARQQIVELLSASVLESRKCLCGATGKDSFEVLSLVERNLLPTRNIICKKCGIVRVDPLPEEIFYKEVYGTLYWKLLHGNAELTKDRFFVSVKRAIPFSTYLRSECLLESKKVVEIGASYGAGLFSFIDQGCHSLVGYDYDIQFIKQGIKYSCVDLRFGGIAEAIKDGVKYNIVILRHVLEHFVDPFSSLVDLKNIIEEDGLLFVEVPGVFDLTNYNNDPLQYFDIFHPYSYSLKTLTMIMNIAGYSMVSGTEHVYSLWKIDKATNAPCKETGEEYLRVKEHLCDCELARLNKEIYDHSFAGKFTAFYTSCLKAIRGKRKK